MSNRHFINTQIFFDIRMLSFLFLRLMAILLHFLASILVVRNLGLEIAGVYFTAFAVIMIIGVIGRLGSENAVVRVVSELEFESNQKAIGASVVFIASSVAACTFLLSVAVVVAIFFTEYYGWSSFLEKGFYRTLIVFSFGLLAYNLMIVFAQAFLGKHHQVISIIYLNLLWLSLFVILQLICKPDKAVDSAWLFNISVISCSFITILHWLFLSSWPRSFTEVAKKDIFRLCSNLFAAEFFQQLVLWAPIVIISFYLTSKDVTEYTIAARIAVISIVVMQASNSFFSPTLAGLKKRESLSSLHRLYSRVTLLVILFSLPVIVVLFVWSEKFIGLYDIFPDKAATYLRILLVGQLFNIFGGVAAVVLVMNGGDRYYKIATLASVISSIGLSVFLCSRYGVIGVATGVVVSLIVTNFLVLFFMKRFVGFWSPCFSIRKLLRINVEKLM